MGDVVFVNPGPLGFRLAPEGTIEAIHPAGARNANPNATARLREGMTLVRVAGDAVHDATAQLRAAGRPVTLTWRAPPADSAAETTGMLSEAETPQRLEAKVFANGADLKRGITESYVEKPFADLADELKDDAGEIDLPKNIYTVAICAGFFADPATWDMLEAKVAQVGGGAVAGLGAVGSGLGAVGGAVGKASGLRAEPEPEPEAGESKAKAAPIVPVAAQQDEPGCCDVCWAFAKNWWLMSVNGFLLLAFHYFLTGTVRAPAAPQH